MSAKLPNYDLLQSEADISRLISDDPWRMDILQAAETLDLPDWWIGAGFLRDMIWDAIEENPTAQSKDVDLVYFDPSAGQEDDWAHDEAMKQKSPFAHWEVRNQARMHYVNDFPPYSSTEDGIAHWVDTATSVAVKLEGQDLKYLFCHGTKDLFGLVARPVPEFRKPELLPVFYRRIEEKNWHKRWPHLRVEAG